MSKFIKPCFQQRTIKLAFLYPGKDDPFINRLVAEVSKNPICHVELVFENDMSFSIFQGSSLFFKQRTFSNPEYKLMGLNVSNAEYVAAYSFCEQAVKENLQFTDVGMVGACIQPQNCPMCCFRPSESTGQTFCSKIVTEALQFAALPEVQGLHPCTTTPSILFDAISASKRSVCDTNSYRRQLLYDPQVVFVNRLT